MRHLLLLILLLLPFPLFAFYDRMGGESVTCLTKDRRQLMWIGSSKGVWCYNGQRFFHVEKTPSSGEATLVNTLCETPDGQIVYGDCYGLHLVTTKSRTSHRIHPELTHVNAIVSLPIRESADSSPSYRVAVGCRQGLFLLSSDLSIIEKKIFIDERNVTSTDNEVVAMATDDTGGLWGANSAHTLLHYDPRHQRVSRHVLPSSALTKGINSLALLRDTLYLGTANKGLLLFHIPTRRLHPSQQLTAPVIKNVSVHSGQLFVCTDGSGAYRIDSQGVHPLPSRSNTVYSTYYDPHLQLQWFGYYQEGLSHQSLREPLFTYYSMDSFTTQGLFVRSFHRHGRQMAIGTREGLWLVDEVRHLVRHLTPQEIGGSIILNVTFFGGRYIFSNYERGLFTVHPTTFELRRLPLPSHCQQANYNRLVSSPDGRFLYAASTMGVLVFDRQLHLVESYDARHSELLNSYVYDLFFDADGKLWISTSRGLCLLDTETKHLQSNGFPKGFFNNAAPLTFHSLDRQHLIASSPATLYHTAINLATFGHYHHFNAEATGRVEFLTPLPVAGSLHFLMGTNNGLFLFDRHFRHFRHFPLDDGSLSPAFTRHPCVKEADGSLLMAHTQGLLQFSPQSLRTLFNRRDELVTFDRYSVDRREHLRDLTGSDSTTLRLPWNFGVDELTLHPFLMDYRPSTDTYFEWQTDDDSLRVIHGGAPIVINSLTPGTHRLLIRKAGEPETTLLLTIDATPSPLFYIELLLLVIALTASHHLIRWRQRLLRRRKEQTEAERNRQQEKQLSIKMKEQEYRDLKRRVRRYMEDEEPYLRNNLRLSEVATHLGTNATTLSQMFNDYMHTNFLDFINHYRLERFKQMASDERLSQQFTVHALSEQCGFKRSTFFSVFKKSEGCTPTEWMKQH